jgi:hypothetical protein
VAEARKKKPETYASKHDFHVIPISQLKTQIKLAEKSKVALAIVGASGIGKSAIVRQAAQEISEDTGKHYECRTIITSQKVPEDFTGIPIPDLERETVKFLKLEELPQDPNSHGILNQADMTVLRALFQLLGERRIGTWKLPDGWSLVAAMNPDGENYGTTKPSPALRRRMSWIEVKFDESAFLNYAENSGFNEAVVEFLKRSPGKMLNKAALTNDKVFACPASWEKFSDVINSMGPNDKSGDLIPIGSGLVGLTYTKDFVRFFDEHKSNIDPKDILEKYHLGNLRTRVQKCVSNGRTDILTDICNSLVFEMLGMSTTDKEFENRSSNFVNYFLDIPDDTAVFFLNQLTKKFYEKGLKTEIAKWKGEIAQTEEGSVKFVRMLKTTDLIAKEGAEARF